MTEKDGLQKTLGASRQLLTADKLPLTRQASDVLMMWSIFSIRRLSSYINQR